jgi:hypothetical protein
VKLTLPFLKESKWPISKEPEERVVNPSYDKQIENHLIEELMIALEQKKSARLRESLIALIEHIKSSGE